MSRPSRLFVLGLDGLAHSLVLEFAAKGVMPTMAGLHRRSPFLQMDSVLPTVSSVAWSCFATARNPGRFGVYGFANVDGDYELSIPDSRNLKGNTIWEELDRAGRRVYALSVPLSHPPRRLDRGTIVSCFLADGLSRETVSPAREFDFLNGNGYEIDVDPQVAWSDRHQFVGDLRRVLAGRRRTMRALLARSDWDLAVLHVMDTDRICHFLLKDYREGTAPFAAIFESFFREVDDLVSDLLDHLPSDCALMILSDHGFCPVQHEVQLNRWLVQEGFLRLDPTRLRDGFAAILPNSLAFALVPGRIHLLHRDRYRGGGVHDGNRGQVADELIQKLAAWRHPDSGGALARAVVRREDVYTGPCVKDAPDILVDPEDGYDFKAALGPGPLFTNSPVTGMHTLHDAHFWFSEPYTVAGGKPSIVDPPGLIFELLDVPVPADADSGRLRLGGVRAE